METEESGECMDGYHIVRCDSHRNINVKKSWTLIGLLYAKQWSSIYRAESQDSIETIGVPSSI